MSYLSGIGRFRLPTDSFTASGPLLPSCASVVRRKKCALSTPG